MLEEIRNSLLDEAIKSPNLLSDLAGLESYVAESYDARSFVELLQNADDSRSSRFAVKRAGNQLLVANDGREFTHQDFESLCRSATSSKHRGTSIGFRGIGFKSVVSFAHTIHLFSGPLEVTFSRELTQRDIPNASRVPLVRIPHPVDGIARQAIAGDLNMLLEDGFRTVFVFADLIAAGIDTEFAAFDPTSLLFLRHIRQVELCSDVETIVTVRREPIDSHTRSVTLANSNGITKWTLVDEGDINLAFIEDDKGIAKLDERQAVVHAFLPTLESTGFPFKINGDISTDPSRTRVILDDRTAAGLRSIAKTVVDLIGNCFDRETTEVDPKFLSALIPNTDPRIADLQRRGFKTELYLAIKRQSTDRFSTFRCRPRWLNSADFSALARASGIESVPRAFEDVEGLPILLKLLGIPESSLLELSPGLCKAAPSVVGAAEIVAHITALHATKQISVESVRSEWKIWPVGDNPVSLDEAKSNGKSLSEDFQDIMVEKAGGITELSRLLTNISDSESSARLLPGKVSFVAPDKGRQPQSKAQPIGLKKWRVAEQQVLAVLESRGWKVNDVSRQNLGFDIEGRTDQNQDVYVEVKSISYAGQAFTLTSNEEAVARQKTTAYLLALVTQTNEQLDIAYITDPINCLKLTRQCRQWAWECSDYDFVPESYPLD